jgi:hypothetical protein
MARNRCAITTISALTGAHEDTIISYILTFGSPTLIGEFDRGEPLGDDVFEIIGTHMVCRFAIYVYTSDSTRVHIKTCGVPIPEAMTYEVRFEPFGMVYETIAALPECPTRSVGHYEPIRDVFKGTVISSPWK